MYPNYRVTRYCPRYLTGIFIRLFFTTKCTFELNVVFLFKATDKKQPDKILSLLD